MHVSGHLGIGKYFRSCGEGLKRHQVYKYVVVFTAPEHNLVVGGKTDMIGLFHNGKLLHGRRSVKGVFITCVVSRESFYVFCDWGGKDRVFC